MDAPKKFECVTARILRECNLNKLKVHLDTPCFLCNQSVIDKQLGKNLMEVIQKRKSDLRYLIKAFNFLNIPLIEVEDIQKFDMISFCSSCSDQIDLAKPFIEGYELMHNGISKFAETISVKLNYAQMKKPKCLESDNRYEMLGKLRAEVFTGVVRSADGFKNQSKDTRSSWDLKANSRCSRESEEQPIKTSNRKQCMLRIKRSNRHDVDPEQTECIQVNGNSLINGTYNFENSENTPRRQTSFLNVAFNVMKNKVCEGDVNSVGTSNEGKKGKINDDRLHTTTKTASSTMESIKKDFDDLYVCESCTLVFLTHDQYKVHECLRQSDKMDTTGVTSNPLKEESPQLPKSFVCSVCTEGFKRYRTVSLHIRNCEGITHKCDMCPQSSLITYESVSKLISHKRIVHTLRKGILCQKCGLSFSKKEYESHQATSHKASKNSEGSDEDVSDKPNPNILEHIVQGNDQSHISIPTEGTTVATLHQRPFKCRDCFMTFIRFDHLKTHQKRIHNTVIAYKCSLCGVEMKCAVELKLHSKKCESSRECLTCPHFDCRYTRRNHYGAHVLTCPSRKVEKSHKCLCCDKSFAMRRSLSMHLRLHVPDYNRLQCILASCQKEYNTEALLYAHINNDHPDLSTELNIQIQSLNRVREKKKDAKKTLEETSKSDSVGQIAIDSIEMPNDSLKIMLFENKTNYSGQDEKDDLGIENVNNPLHSDATQVAKVHSGSK